MDKFNYEDIKRERLTAILSGLIYELAFNDYIQMFEDKELLIRTDYREATDIFIDKLSSLDDEDFKKFRDKLVNLITEL